MCINSYYKDSKPYCKQYNDICGYVKHCIPENKFMLSERSPMCPMFNKPVIKIPKEAYKVAYIKRNKLCVTIPEIDQNRYFENPYDYEPNFVYLKNVNGDYEIISEDEFKNPIKVEEVKVIADKIEEKVVEKDMTIEAKSIKDVIEETYKQKKENKTKGWK